MHKVKSNAKAFDSQWLLRVPPIILGGLLTFAAVWLNACHVAEAEGWASPLVTAGIVVTLAAAVAPPYAERLLKQGDWLKALTVALFFGFAVCFSLSASISRSSSYATGKVATVEQSNGQTKQLEARLQDAIEARTAECATGRGPKCRALETKVEAARMAVSEAKPVQSTDPGAERLATITGVAPDKVRLWQPLFLPLGLELGGFIFLAIGLAPLRRRCEPEIAKPEKIAKHSEVVAKLMRDALAKPAKTGAVGTKAYYMARLDAEFPHLAAKVRDGSQSCFAACVAAGLRKPAKAKKVCENA